MWNANECETQGFGVAPAVGVCADDDADRAPPPSNGDGGGCGVCGLRPSRAPRRPLVGRWNVD